MAYVNLASATKLHRASQINTDIGSAGFMLLYTGTVPASPDMTATGTLLAQLPLASTAAVTSLAVQSAVITTPGTGGTDGTYALSFSGGGGTGAAGYYVVTGGVITSAVISDPGTGYTGAPTIDGFGAAGLTGAALTPVMTAVLTFNAVTAATAGNTGVAGWVRVTKADGVTGIIDLDIGVTNDFSVVINSTMIIASGSVTCSAQVLMEA